MFTNPDSGKVIAAIILWIVALISMNVLPSRIFVNKNVPTCGDLTDVIADRDIAWLQTDEAVLILMSARNMDRFAQVIALMNPVLIGVLVLKDMFCLPMKGLARILMSVKDNHLVGDPINIVSILVEASNVLVSWKNLVV